MNLYHGMNPGTENLLLYMQLAKICQYVAACLLEAEEGSRMKGKGVIWHKCTYVSAGAAWYSNMAIIIRTTLITDVAICVNYQLIIIMTICSWALLALSDNRYVQPYLLHVNVCIWLTRGWEEVCGVKEYFRLSGHDWLTPMTASLGLETAWFPDTCMYLYLHVFTSYN